MTYQDLYALGGFVGVILTLVLGGRRWAEGRISETRKDLSEHAAKIEHDAAVRADTARALAEQARAELAEHRLHVAEAYVSKEGLREVKDEIMIALREVKGTVDGTNARIDRVIETRPQGRSRGSP